MKLSPLWIAIPCLVSLLAGSGCSKQQPAWYEGIYNLSKVPLSADLAPAVAAGVATLDEPPPVGKGVRDYREFAGLIARILPLETRAQAGNELYARWRAEPENLFWIELALNYNGFLRRDDDIERMWSTTAVGDTNKAAGAFFEGWISHNRRRQARMYHKAAAKSAEVDSVGQVWLNVKLATAQHHSGHTIDAVRRLLEWLPVARRTGGPAYEARLWLTIARRLAVIDRQDDALYAAALSSALAHHANSRYAEIYAGIVIGQIMGRRQESESAIARLEAIVDEAEQHRYYWLMQKGLDSAAEIAVANGNYDRALALDRRQLPVTYAIGDSLNAPRNLVSIANSFRAGGQIDSCFAYLSRAEHIVKEFSDQRNLPRMTENLAEYYCLVGNYAVAESLLMEARGLSSTTGAEIHEARMLLKLLPQALEMGRVELAYSWLGRLAELKGTLYNGGLDQNLRADYWLLSANLHSRQGEFQLAAEALAKAQVEIDLGGGEGLAWKYALSLGDLALLRDDYSAAENAFAQCLALARASAEPDQIASSRIRLGHLYLATDRLSEAEALFKPDGPDAVFGPRYRTRLISQLLLGITYAREGRQAEALVVLQHNLDQFNSASPPDLVMRFSLAKGQALAAIGRTDDAVTVLRDVLASSEDVSQSISFDELKILDSGVGRVAADALIGLYFEQPKLLSGDDLGRETLRLAGVLADRIAGPGIGAPWFVYRVGTERSWLWVIDKDGPVIHILPGEGALRRLIKPVLADMMLPGRPVNQRAATQLAEILLGPGLGSWQQDHTLTIVPDGLLQGIPWSALPVPTPDDSSTLVLDRGPVLEFASTVRPKKHQAAPAELSLLAIGCDSAPLDSDASVAGLPRLRRAEYEAELIYAQWPTPNRRLLVGRGANWDAITADGLAESGVIHLASHAQVFQGLPQRSTLRLSAGKTAVPITIQAVSRLNLQAELVYLSCCNAARRLSTTGSGVSGFADAFLTAGARTVIASTNWVEDEASAFIAERFYEHWFSGVSKAEALRAAQQDLRAARGQWEHPSYWAFFRLIGDER